MKMSLDDIDRITLQLHDFLVGNLGCNLGEDQDYEDLQNFMYDKFEDYCTKDRNYN